MNDAYFTQYGHWLNFLPWQTMLLRVDGTVYGVIQKGFPMRLLGDKRPVWMKIGKRAAATSCYSENTLRQMKADRVGRLFQTAALTQQPFFRVDL